jgi:hypothetical protein
MKLNTKLQHWLTSATAGLALIASASVGLAQNTNPTNTFDTSSSTTSLVSWWGIATMAWDGTRDAASDPASGSARYTTPFVGAAGEQFMTFFTIANRWGWDFGTILDATTYTNLSFDIKVDPSSGQRKNNNDYGNLEIGLCTGSGPGTTYVGNGGIPLSAATGWQHISYPLTPTLVNIGQVSGFYLKMWSNGDHTNTLVFNIDNFEITKPTVPIVIPPPTLSLEKATPGLQLISTAAGGANARQSIHPATAGYSWMNSPTPTTYAVTIKQYPPYAAYPNFQTHMFFEPAGSQQWGPGDASGDWNSTNLIFVQIADNADGSAYARFMYKTNFGGGWGGQVFGSNTIATVGSTTILGTWSLTFSQNTNVTLTSPDGSSTNFVFPAESAAYFADPNGLYAYIGIQPNSAGNVGQYSVLSEVKITGAVNGAGTPSPNIVDTFAAAPLNTNTWGTAASDAAGILVADPDTLYWLLWTVPDSGFALQYEANATAPASAWGDPQNLMANVMLLGTQKRVAVPKSLSPTDQLYFQLVKRVATKLQVLLPGETNAPGTLTGKVGTPDPVSLGGTFPTITVHAVDATWHIVPGVSDALSFSSTDPTPAVFSPATPSLVNGTATTVVMFGAEGSWTITATDTTKPTISAGTSSSVTVGP